MKTVKFKAGRDADKMLLRKLLKNFIIHGKITTTRKKVKYLRSRVERVLHYAKNGSQATESKLRSALADRKVETMLKKQVAPVFKEKMSGFTKITFLTPRISDSSQMAKLEWSLPVIIEEPKPVTKEKVVKESKAQVKEAKPKKAVKKSLKPAKK